MKEAIAAHQASDQKDKPPFVIDPWDLRWDVDDKDIVALDYKRHKVWPWKIKVRLRTDTCNKLTPDL